MRCHRTISLSRYHAIYIACISVLYLQCKSLWVGVKRTYCVRGCVLGIVQTRDPSLQKLKINTNPTLHHCIMPSYLYEVYRIYNVSISTCVSCEFLNSPTLRDEITGINSTLMEINQSNCQRDILYVHRIASHRIASHRIDRYSKELNITRVAMNTSHVTYEQSILWIFIANHRKMSSSEIQIL